MPAVNMTHGWTGGQYSLYRGAFGAYLFVHFAWLIPWAGELFSNRGALPDASASPLFGLFPNVLQISDSPAAAVGLVSVAAGLSVLFAVGWLDRTAAVGLWYVGACLVGRNPLISNPGLPFLGWLLLAHAFVRPAPYLSLSARGRVDPRGGWSLDGRIYGAGWIVMALGYTYSGYTKLISPSWLDGSAIARILDNPLARPGPIRELMLALPDLVLRFATWGSLAAELLFAPLALFRRLRPALWFALLAMHLSLMLVIDFADLSLGMVVLHLFTFDPRWVRPLQAGSKDTVFYDGSCGLCHRAVRFVLAEDREDSFRFAPLGGETFEQAVPQSARSGLPDSLLIATADGRLLTRARGVRHLLERLGGYWRCLAWVSRVVPAALLDFAYDRVATIRHRLFRRPPEACPILPPELRERFES